MAKKMKYLIPIIIVVALIAGYFLFFSKKDDSKNSLSSDSPNNDNKPTSTGSNTGTGTGGTGGTGTQNEPVIAIQNPSLTVSPLIGQKHLKATINVTNQPNTGIMTVKIGNVFLVDVSLPLVNGSYLLDEYIALPQQSVYNLTANIGSVSKTVQVNAPS